jgi:hypothetical protein
MEKEMTMEKLCKMPITKRIEWLVDNLRFTNNDGKDLSQIINHLKKIKCPTDCYYNECPIPISCNADILFKLPYTTRKKVTSICGIIFTEGRENTCGCTLLKSGLVRKSLVLSRLRLLRKIFMERRKQSL